MTRTVAAFAVLTALAVPAHAQQPPVAQTPPTYDADKFKMPSTPPTAFVPGTSDLWRYNLQFGSPNGYANLAPQEPASSDGLTPPSRRISPLNKGFYGLKLSTPIN